MSDLLKRIADYFANDYQGDDKTAPTMEITVNDLRYIANMNIERCRAESELRNIKYNKCNDCAGCVQCKVDEANAIQEYKSTDGWIPVSERLPDEAFGCLVTVMDCEPSTYAEFENILPYFVGYDGRGWIDADGEEIPFEVIAWQPLPEVYKN